MHATSPEATTTIASLVKGARVRHDLSQHALARLAGVSRPTVARLELGQDISMVKLGRIAGALGMRVTLEVAEPTKSAELTRATD